MTRRLCLLLALALSGCADQTVTEAQMERLVVTCGTLKDTDYFVFRPWLSEEGIVNVYCRDGSMQTFDPADR